MKTTVASDAIPSSRPERSGVEGPCLHDKPLLVERRSLDYAALQATPPGTTEVKSATPSSRPERSGVEGPPLHHKSHIVERRSLDYAALQAAPLGTTAATDISAALLHLTDQAERRQRDVLGRVLRKLDDALSAVTDLSPLPEAKR